MLLWQFSMQISDFYIVIERKTMVNITNTLNFQYFSDRTTAFERTFRVLQAQVFLFFYAPTINFINKVNIGLKVR